MYKLGKNIMDGDRVVVQADYVQRLFDNAFIPFDPANTCLLYTSPSPRDRQKSRMPSSA